MEVIVIPETELTATERRIRERKEREEERVKEALGIKGLHGGYELAKKR